MQIVGLHRSIYKLYSYARKQECLDAYRTKYDSVIKQWELLKSSGTRVDKIPEIVGYSRATYYRAKKILVLLSQGQRPPSKRPHRVNKPRWGEAQRQLVLRVRRDNPTYGKAKIAVILARDFQQFLSESSVGRILKQLMTKGLISRSSSAIRSRKKRQFSQGHAKRWRYERL